MSQFSWYQWLGTVMVSKTTGPAFQTSWARRCCTSRGYQSYMWFHVTYPGMSGPLYRPSSPRPSTRQPSPACPSDRLCFSIATSGVFGCASR